MYKDVTEDPSFGFHQYYVAFAQVKEAFDQAQESNPEYAAALQAELVEKQQAVLSERGFRK